MIKNQSIILLKITLFVIVLFSSGCNKTNTQFNVAGNWSYFKSTFSFFVNNTHLAYTSQLEVKLLQASNLMRTVLDDPQTIIIEPDGTFRFIFKSNNIAFGTYIIDGQIITFKFSSGHYPEVESLIAVTDSNYLNLYLSMITLKPIFLSFFDLNLKDYDSLFNEIDPIIEYMESSILFKLSNSKYTFSKK